MRSSEKGQTTQADFTVFIFPIAQGTDTSRPPPRALPPRPVRAEHCSGPPGGRASPLLRSPSLVSRFHTSARPHQHHSPAQVKVLLHRALSFPWDEAGGCIEDKTISGTELVAPLTIVAERGTCTAEKKCMVKGGRMELEKGREETK